MTPQQQFDLQLHNLCNRLAAGNTPDRPQRIERRSKTNTIPTIVAFERGDLYPIQVYQNDERDAPSLLLKAFEARKLADMLNLAADTLDQEEAG